jgi:hypothetical protein
MRRLRMKGLTKGLKLSKSQISYEYNCIKCGGEGREKGLRVSKKEIKGVGVGRWRGWAVVRWKGDLGGERAIKEYK